LIDFEAVRPLNSSVSALDFWGWKALSDKVKKKLEVSGAAVWDEGRFMAGWKFD